MKNSTLKLSFIISLFAFLSMHGVYSQKKIAFITNAFTAAAKHYEDSATIAALWEAGYEVDTIADRNLDNLADSATAVFYNRITSADVVIISRSTSSGNYDGTSKTNWATVTTPVMMCSPYQARSSRLNLFPSNALGLNDTNTIAKFRILDDYVLTNVTPDDDSLVSFYIDAINTLIYGADSLERTTNWKLIASCDTTNSESKTIAIARLTGGKESYDSSGFTPSAPWTYFPAGRAEQLSSVNNYQFSEAGKKIFLNEIARLSSSRIAFITNSFTAPAKHYEDSATVTALWEEGFAVDTIVDRNMDNLADSATAVFYNDIQAAHIVIISRSSNSGNYDGTSKTNWATVTTPVMICSPFLVRSNRLGLFPSATLGLNDSLTIAKFHVTEDNILNKVSLDDDSTTLFYIDAINTLVYGADSLERTTNWKLIASCDTLENAAKTIAIARLEAGDTTYTGSGFAPAAPWVYFPAGRAQEASSVNNYQFTEAGKQIYLNEIRRLLGTSEKELEEKFDATLSDIKVGGTTIEGFSSGKTTYTLKVTAIPVVTATANDAAATVVITAATAIPGTTTITVTNQTTEKIYRINFVGLSNDATLSDLKVDGTTIAGFNASTLTYTVDLPVGTLIPPVVTATANDANATAVVTGATSLPGNATILVTAEDGTAKTYEVIFNILSGILKNNSEVEFGINPNPVDENALISFHLPVSGLVNISVIDISGKEIETILFNTLSAGKNSINFNTSKLTEGIYFVKIIIGNNMYLNKVVVAR